jgi:hypothetical protein
LRTPVFPCGRITAHKEPKKRIIFQELYDCERESDEEKERERAKSTIYFFKPEKQLRAGVVHEF